MSKKVLSLLLLVTLLMSMAAVANAADFNTVADELKPTAVAYVTVANADPLDAQNASIYPPGSSTGVFAPKVGSDNLISILGRYEDIESKTFNVGIAFNGLFDPNYDFVQINGSWVDLKSASKHTVSADGLYSILYTTFSIPKNNYADDQSASQTYKIHVVKSNRAEFNYSFTIEFVDTTFAKENLIGLDTTDYSSNVSDVKVDVIVPEIPEEITLSVLNATVSCKTRLNVRSGASTSAPIIGKLTNGTGVYVVEVVGKWAQIAYEGKEAYVYVDYLNLK